MEQGGAAGCVIEPKEFEHEHKQVQLPSTTISVEEMIEQNIGHLNTTQILQAILGSLPSLFDSQQTYISVFAHAQPSWHCTTNSNSCKSNSNLCTLPKTEWTWDYSGHHVHTSIISEWNLECENPFLKAFPTTIYFIGCLIGGLLFATLGDSKLGRKNLLCMSFLLMSLAALASAFAPNVWVYSVFRFICGVGRAPLAICALVLLTEKVGRRWRCHMVMIGFIHFSVGILILACIAYLTRHDSWRYLYLWTSIPGIICCLISYLFLYESPRWLFTQNRVKDAIDVLRKLGSKTAVFSINNLNMDNQRRGLVSSTTTSPIEALKVLIKKKWAVQRLLACLVLALGIGLMYFGMFLGIGNLGFNIYITAIFSAVLSLASYLLTFLYWLQNCNRRISLIGFCTISGATSIAFSVIGQNHKAVLVPLELISLFCACMAYNLVLMYTVELFPTCVRHSASSLVRQAMIFGSVFDPMLIILGRVNRVYSYGVFGIVVLVCGLLVLCLPETRGKVMCDTMEEQEAADNGHNIFV